MAKTDRYTAKQMITAIRETKGMITLAAQQVGCSYNTMRRYVDKYPTVAQALAEEHERTGDMVELTLYNKAIKEKDTAALIFLAKTKFKSRGYVERREHKIDDWRTQAIADIRAGTIDYEALAEAFDTTLATELFRAAGIPIQISEDHEA